MVARRSGRSFLSGATSGSRRLASSGSAAKRMRSMKPSIDLRRAVTRPRPGAAAGGTIACDRTKPRSRYDAVIDSAIENASATLISLPIRDSQSGASCAEGMESLPLSSTPCRRNRRCAAPGGYLLRIEVLFEQNRLAWRGFWRTAQVLLDPSRQRPAWRLLCQQDRMSAQHGEPNAGHPYPMLAWHTRVGMCYRGIPFELKLTAFARQ